MTTASWQRRPVARTSMPWNSTSATCSRPPRRASSTPCTTPLQRALTLCGATPSPGGRARPRQSRMVIIYSAQIINALYDPFVKGAVFVRGYNARGRRARPQHCCMVCIHGYHMTSAALLLINQRWHHLRLSGLSCARDQKGPCHRSLQWAAHAASPLRGVEIRQGMATSTERSARVAALSGEELCEPESCPDMQGCGLTFQTTMRPLRW